MAFLEIPTGLYTAATGKLDRKLKLGYKSLLSNFQLSTVYAASKSGTSRMTSKIGNLIRLRIL
jgi:hypothetical protein